MNRKLRSQKLSLVRGEPTVVVGIDIAKKKHWACIMDSLTELPIGNPFTFQNTKDGFLRLLGQIGKAKAATGATRVIVGMEPSGHYWKPLAAFLRNSEVRVVTVSPLHVKLAKEWSDNSPTKHDPKDAETIALQIVRADFFDPYLPEGVYADLRGLTQARQQQRVKLNQILNRLRALLDEFFPEFTEVFEDPIAQTAAHVLRNYPFPGDILAQPLEKLAKELKTVSRGRLGMARAIELHRAAADSIGVTSGLKAARHRLSQLLDEVDFLRDQMAKTETEMAAALQETGLAPYLLSVPGIGVITAASLLGEAGDLSRYEDWRQLRKLAGFNLKENSSGDYRSRTKITKRGRSGLRCVLYQATLVLVAKNKQFKALFEHFKTRQQNPLKGKQAMIAVACKLLRVLFTLATKRRHYDPAVVLGDYRTNQIGLAA